MLIGTLLRETKQTAKLITPLGWTAAALYGWQQNRFLYRALTPSGPYRLRSRHSRYPLLCRPQSSDKDIFNQVFIDREYSPLGGLSGVRFVIDCGAYVGYSGSYFLTQFPDCQLIAVEADGDNFEMLKRNL